MLRKFLEKVAALFLKPERLSQMEELVKKAYLAATLDRENAATEYQKQTDKKERTKALKVWQEACERVHDLEDKHRWLNGFIK